MASRYTTYDFPSSMSTPGYEEDSRIGPKRIKSASTTSKKENIKKLENVASRCQPQRIRVPHSRRSRSADGTEHSQKKARMLPVRIKDLTRTMECPKTIGSNKKESSRPTEMRNVRRQLYDNIQAIPSYKKININEEVIAQKNVQLLSKEVGAEPNEKFLNTTEEGKNVDKSKKCLNRNYSSKKSLLVKPNFITQSHIRKTLLANEIVLQKTSVQIAEVILENNSLDKSSSSREMDGLFSRSLDSDVFADVTTGIDKLENVECKKEPSANLINVSIQTDKTVETKENNANLKEDSHLNVPLSDFTENVDKSTLLLLEANLQECISHTEKTLRKLQDSLRTIRVALGRSPEIVSQEVEVETSSTKEPEEDPIDFEIRSEKSNVGRSADTGSTYIDENKENEDSGKQKQSKASRKSVGDSQPRRKSLRLSKMGSNSGTEDALNSSSPKSPSKHLENANSSLRKENTSSSGSVQSEQRRRSLRLIQKSSSEKPEAKETKSTPKSNSTGSKNTPQSKSKLRKGTTTAPAAKRSLKMPSTPTSSTSSFEDSFTTLEKELDIKHEKSNRNMSETTTPKETQSSQPREPLNAKNQNTPNTRRIERPLREYIALKSTFLKSLNTPDASKFLPRVGSRNSFRVANSNLLSTKIMDSLCDLCNDDEKE